MDKNKTNSTNKHLKKEVQWLDEVGDYRKAYKNNLQTLSCLWNDVTPIQLQHLNEFIIQTEMMDSTDTCLSYKNESISAKGFLSLSDQTWVTDDVVNFYCKLLTDRDTKLVKSQLHKKTSILLSSFFYRLLKKNLDAKNYLA
jgi:Ulp1 family protease